MTSVWSPTWAQDGRKIFYVSNRGGSMDLWQQAVDHNGGPAGEPVLITPGLGIRTAAFSPNGARVAFTRGGTVSNVFQVAIRAGQPATWADARQLTSEHAFIEFIDLSPDGKVLALSSNRHGNQDLWLLPVSGGDMTQLTIDPTPDWNPRWSPDGSQIAFYALRSGNRDIWVMPSGGGLARQISSSPFREWFPAWTPDGRSIAYTRAVTPGGAESYVVDVSGGSPRFLAHGNYPEPAPDGTWFITRADGLFRVAAGDRPEELLLPSAVNAFRVARDGRSVLYSVVTGPPASHGVYKFSLADRAVSRMTKLEGRRGRLGYYFAAGAQHLYVTWREDEGDIWAMDVVKPTSR